ncbi:MAG TPA: TonB-dependent receptor [Candidatus Angelobacter sp.]|nr:TonB-dependent receptor [Candidatus Angelobacter sp.]
MLRSSIDFSENLSLVEAGVKRYAAVFAILGACVAQAAEIRGKVVSAIGGEALRRVQVTVLERKNSTVTSDDGTFTLYNLPPGKYTLQTAAVGYRLVNTAFVISSDDDNKDFSITLAPETLRRTEVVEVKGDIFHGENPAIPSQLTLTPQELKEAATVLANDPFRALQTLPGVSPTDNNDFFGQFSVLGAPFARVGVYLDDVVVPQPFHTIPNLSDGASLSVFSTETLQELSLMEVAYPVRYAEMSGAALAIRTREGSRTRPHFTISAGLADSELLGEGGLGSAGKGSWLISARKSYLNYLYRRRGGDPTTDVAFEDIDVKLNYDLSSQHSLSFYSLIGHTDFNHSEPNPDANTLNTGTNDLALLRLGWRFAATPSLMLDSHAGFIRQKFDLRNFSDVTLNTDYYGEWEGGTRLAWSWNKDHVLEAGYTTRRLRDSGYLQFFDFVDPGPSIGNLSNGTGLRQSGFVQQGSNFFGHRLSVMAGLRWDSIGQIGFHPITPQVSAAWRFARRTQLQFGYGRYAEFPGFQLLATPCATPAQGTVIVPEGMLIRSNQYTAALEQRVTENVRVRVEGFARENRNIFGLETITPAGCSSIKPDSSLDPFAQPNNSRGMQVIVQRRSANRLSGWIGYTLDYSRQKLLVAGSPTPVSIEAPTLTDQRHTLNTFAMYRLTPTINLSGKFIYGSGIPISALQVLQVGNTFVPIGPGHDVFGPYQRLDLRFDKAWAFSRWKMTLYVEGLNLTNHDNPRFITSAFNPATGKFIAVTEKGLPATPTAGVSFEF